MTLAWASSICCCSITCHFELGRHKSKLFSTFSTNGNVPNNTSSFYLHLLKVALKKYLICSLTLNIIFLISDLFWWFLPQILTKILTQLNSALFTKRGIEKLPYLFFNFTYYFFSLQIFLDGFYPKYWPNF